jgi:phosphate transport system protein
MAEADHRHRLPGFDQALEALRADALLMGSLVRRSFHHARVGFEQRDDEACTAAIADDEEIDLLEKQLDKAGTDLLLRYAPEAFVLRVVLSTLKAASLFERLADVSVAIARRARKLNQEPLLEEAHQAQAAWETLERALTGGWEAFWGFDGPSAERLQRPMEPLAQAARDLDDAFSALLPERPQDARALVNLMAIAQGLETSAYLLENLAEAVIYAAEAKDVRHPGNKLEVF